MLTMTSSAHVAVEGPWYRLASVTADARSALCSPAERRQRHSETAAASLHTDVHAAQVQMLLQHRALAACLPALCQRLDALVGAGLQSTSGAHPRMPRPAAPPSSQGESATSLSRSGNASALGDALSQSCDVLWHTIAPPDGAEAALQRLGEPRVAPAASGTSLRFLGTGSSEPSKFRGPTGILLQVRFLHGCFLVRTSAGRVAAGNLTVSAAALLCRCPLSARQGPAQC